MLATKNGVPVKPVAEDRVEAEWRRFDVLSQVGDLQGKSVLDVGCGVGELCGFLRARQIEAAYTGLDRCAEIAEAARERHPGAHFATTPDILGFVTTETWDYVVSDRLFAHWTAETAARVEPTLERLFALCKRGVAVNFLSARAETKSQRALYLAPTVVLQAAWRLTPALVLRHDYAPNDFTLFLYREARWP
jgi:trans-aconitate methyltransferase